MPHQLNIQNLREAAASLGDHTGYAIAKRTQLSESTISRLLNHACQPTVATQNRFLDVYKLPINQLMTDEQVAA